MVSVSTADDTLTRMVNSMRELNVPLAKAEEAARRHLGLPPLAVPIGDVDDDAIEDVHVLEGEKLLRALGWEIVHFSQKKRAKVTPGIPDRKAYHRARRLTFWWEAKASWGRQSNAQRQFQLMAEAVGEYYVLGGLDALVQWLESRGLGTMRDGVFEPNP